MKEQYNKLYRLIILIQIIGFFFKNKGTLFSYLDILKKKLNINSEKILIHEIINSNINNKNKDNKNNYISKITSLINSFYLTTNNNNNNNNNNNDNHNNNDNNEFINNSNIIMEYNEFIFWRVIKNKLIFNNILKYLPNSSNIYSFKYYEIIHVDWMIDNNKKELLYYKVKNGDYLVFNLPFLNNKINKYNNKTSDSSIYPKYSITAYNSNQNNEIFLKLFKYLKKDNEEFFINLFRNYSNYFLIDIDITIKQSIKVNCFSALKVLFEYYNAKISKEQELSILKYCFENKNFKCINFILNSKYLKYLPLNIKENEIFILFKHCPFGEIGINTNLSNIYNFNLNPENHEEKSFKLSKLIESCKFINNLLNFEFFKIESNYNLNYKNLLSNEEININSYIFKDKLNCTILSIIKQKQEYNEQLINYIGKLLLMYLSFSNQESKNIRYYLTFNECYTNDQDIFNMDINESFSKCCMLGFRYGNYILIKRWFNKLSKTNIFFEKILFQSWVGELFKRYESPEFLFQHCNCKDEELLEKKKRIFIDSIYKDLIDEDLDNDFKFHPLFILNLCVATDNLDLVIYTYGKLKQGGFLEKIDQNLIDKHLLHHNFSLNVYRYIRSTKVFDFIYHNFHCNGIIPINGTNITSWFHFGKITLLKHYQSIIESTIGSDERTPFSRKPYGIENRVSSKSVVHILSNTKKFKIDYHYMIECIDGQFIDIMDLNDIKYIINNCHCSAKKIKFNIFMVMTSSKFKPIEKIEFFNWFFRNNPINYLDFFGDYNMELNKRILSPIHLNLINGYLYLTGRLDQVLLNNTKLNYHFKNNQNLNNNDEFINITNYNNSDIYQNIGLKNLSLFHHDNCNEIFYSIGLLNDTDTLDLIMVLDNQINSTLSFSNKEYSNNKKKYLFELLLGAVHYGRLSMIQYFYNNYKSIFLGFNNNNHNNNQYDILLLFKDAIINNYYDIVEWFIEILDLKISKSILFNHNNNNNYNYSTLSSINNTTNNSNNIFTEKDFKNSIIYKNFKNIFI